MVKIRLRRVGAKKQPSFRVVVADSRAARDGRFIEQIGFYNPRTEPETLRIDEARALHWLSVGAQPTESVARLLKTTGTMERFERLKQGEALDELVAEAEEEAETEAPEAEAEEPAEAEVEEVAEGAETAEEIEAEEPEAEEPEAEEPEAEEPTGEEIEAKEPEPEASEVEGEDEVEEAE